MDQNAQRVFRAQIFSTIFAIPGVKTVEIRDTVKIADASNRFLRVRVTR